MSNDLHFNIRLTYDDTGLKGMKAGVESMKKVMQGLNDAMPKMATGNKRTVYGQLAGDVRSLGNAAEKAAPKIDRFVTSLTKFNVSLVTRSLQQLNQISGDTTRATGNIINAQARLRESLDRSTTSFRAAGTAAKTFTKAQSDAAKAQAALLTAQTKANEQNFKQANYPQEQADKRAAQAAKERMHAENLALRQQTQNFREQQAALRQTERANAAAAKQAAEQAARIRAAYQTIIKTVRELASAIASTLTSAIRSAGTALSSFGTSAASRFASLRTQLDATGKAFLRLGNDSRTAGTAFNQMWSGDTLIRTGRNLMQFVHQGQMLLRNTYSQFANVEQSISRAAVAGIDPTEDDQGKITGFSKINMEQMWDFVYKTQRGEYGNEAIRSLSTQELADSIYYLTSAIGVGPTTSENQAGIANMVGPMAIWASATQTSPEEYIKGVLGIGQQFGFNPRDFDDPDTSKVFGGISGMVGYLANVSSMEPSDVIAAMRMVGPSSYAAYGGDDALKWDSQVRERAMFDTFLATFAASEVGLRGSQVGRGYQRVFSGFADATPKTRGLISDAVGFENTEENYKKWLYDDNGVMDFGGNGQGVLGIAGFLRDFKKNNGLEEFNDLIYGLFTENATRAMASTLAGMDSGMFKQIEDALAAGNFDFAYELLNSVMEQETALISNAVTNMSNAWGQFANSIFRTSGGMIIKGLDSISNVFRELSDVLMDFPKLGQAVAGVFSGLMVGTGLVGGLLMLAGTIVSVNRALGLIGISAGIVTKALVALPLLLMRMVPILFLVGAASVALKTAWDNNFLGMRDTITSLTSTLSSGNFSDSLLTFLGTDKFQEIHTWAMRLKDAFSELISGVFFNVGTTDNLGALLYTVFGRISGGFLYENMIRLRFALSDLRGAASDFFAEMKSGASIIPDVLRTVNGFFDILLTGRMGSRGNKGVSALGEMLGIEDFDEQFQNFALNQRNNLAVAYGAFVEFGSVVKGVLSDIGSNLGMVLTFENLAAAVSAAMNFLTGFAAGISIAFLSALRAVEAVTGALAQLGVVGRGLSEFIEGLTGIEVTLDNVSRAIGVAFGMFLGGRFLAPLLLFNTTLKQGAVALVGLSLGLAQVAFSVFSAVAGFGVLGGAIAIVAVLLGGVLAAMFAYTAATQGMESALQGLSDAWGAFKGVMSETISNIYDFGSAVVTAALDIAGISSSMISFEEVGRGIANVVSTVGYAVAGAIGGIVLFGAALFKIGREHAPTLIKAVKQIAPIVAGIGGVIALGLFGAFEAVMKLVELFNTIGPAAWIASAAVVMAILAITSPITAIVLAIAAIGLAFLALTGDADSMAGILSNIVSTLPEPWQDAANNIILAFATAFDFIRSNAAAIAQSPIGKIMGLDGYTYTAQDSLVIQYKSAQGTLSPRDVSDFNQTTNQPMTDFSNFQYTKRGGLNINLANEEVARDYWWIKEDIQGINSAHNFTIGNQGISDNFSPFEIWKETSTAPYKDSISEEDWLIGQEWALRETVGSQVDRRNEVRAVFAPNSETEQLWVNADGTYGTKKTGQTAYDAYGGFTYRNPMADGMASWAKATRPQTTTANAKPDDAEFWDKTAQVQGAPAGSVKSREDFDKWFSDQYNLHSTPNYSDYKKYLPPEIAEQIQAIEDRNKYLDEINRYMGAGYTQQEATDLVDGQYAYANIPIPDISGQLPDWEQQLADAEKLANISVRISEYLDGMTSGPNALANYYDFRAGNGKAGGSAAGFLSSQWDAISAAVGDSEWFNEHEMMADAAVMGVLGDNMYGQNTHVALADYWQRVADENGIAVETLLADIPKWFAPEQVSASAFTDLMTNLNDMPEHLSKQMDTFGLAEGWTQFGLDWFDLSQYAASKAMAGQEWDFTDYMREGLNMSEEQIQQAVDSYDVDFSSIGSNWMEGTEMLALSMSKGINIISKSQMDAAEELMASGDETKKVIQMTAEEIAAMDEGTARYLQADGWVIVLVEPEIVDEPFKNAAQAAFDNAIKWVNDQVDQGFKNAIKPRTGPTPTTTTDGTDGTGGPVIGLPNAGTTGRNNHSSGYVENEPSWTYTKPGTESGGELPPKRLEYKRPVDIFIEEHFGSIEVLNDAASNGVQAAIDAVLSSQGDVQRTERSRVEKVKLEFEFDAGSAGSIEDAAMAMAAQFAANFTSAFAAQNIGVAVDAVLSSAFVSGGAATTAGQVAAAGFVSSFVTTLAAQLGPALSSVLTSVVGAGMAGGEGGSPMELTITANIEDATAKIGDLYNTQLPTLTGGQYIVKIDGDSIPAQEHVAAVARALANLIEGEYVVTITANDQASLVISAISEALDLINGKTATTTIRTVRETVSVDRSASGFGANALGFFATGGIVSGSNYQIVGEEGPELVKLPWGSRVHPHEETMSMLQKLNSTELRANNYEVSERKINLPVIDARGSNNGSGDNQQPIQISFGDVTINGDQDITDLVDKIDHELSKRNSNALRGQVSVDYRSYND